VSGLIYPTVDPNAHRDLWVLPLDPDAPEAHAFLVPGAQPGKPHVLDESEFHCLGCGKSARAIYADWPIKGCSQEHERSAAGGSPRRRRA
jgi:hypothetical protein